MKNYWLNRKAETVTLKSISTKGIPGYNLRQIDFAFSNGRIFTCSVKDGGLFTKMGGEKKKETLENIDREFDIAERLAKELFQGNLRD